MSQPISNPSEIDPDHKPDIVRNLTDAVMHSFLPTIFTDALVANNPVTLANDAFLALVGHARDAVVGRPVIDLLGSVADHYTLSLFKSAISRDRNGLWQMRIIRESGATFLGVVYLTPIQNQAGRLVAHCINVVDLASLICISKDRESIFPGIYDKAPGFIALSRGQNHTYSYANASYLEFVKRGDLIGKTVAEALPEIVDAGIIAILDEVYRTGNPFSASDMPILIWDSKAERSDERWIDVVYQPVRDQDGVIIGLFCEGHDVTDLHETNAALAALQMKLIHVSRVNAMGTMAAMLAHELNQPLTAISNYVAGVRPMDGQAPDVSRLTTAMSGVKEASERAAGIIDHLRQMTKHRKPSREPFKLREAVGQCLRLVQSSYPGNIAFDNRIPGHLVVTADRVKIQQVVINLLQNACEAMANTDLAIITITAMEDDQNLTVCVADTGSGVLPEAVSTMFAWTESTKDDGMGIGLSICRTIIELYRGSIWMEHSGPDGSEFRFSLPITPEARPDDGDKGSPAR